MRMRFSLRPITSALSSMFIGKHLLTRAVEVVEIAPSTERETLPPICLPGEFSRVRESVKSSTVRDEQKILSATSRAHGPTLLYRFDNAILGNRTVYAAGTYEVKGVRGRRPIIFGERLEINEAMLCTHTVAELFFGHWLKEAMPLEMLASKLDLPALSFNRRPWSHEAGYRKLMDLPGMPISFARVETLWIPDYRGLNEHFVRSFNELRDRVRSAGDGTGPSLVYMDRGVTGKGRNIENSKELVSALTKWGFEIVHPEKLSTEALVRKLADAKMLICVEGSAQVHAAFALPSGATMISLQPSEHFNTAVKSYTDISGIQFAYLVCEGNLEHISVDIPRLRRLLDIVESK